jgi:hypothetical protein
VSEKKIQTGYYDRPCPQNRVRVHGLNRNGHLVIEYESGRIELRMESEADDWTYLPDCTGWDWEPPKPKTRTVELTKWLYWDTEGREFVLECVPKPENWNHAIALSTRTVEVPCE